MTRRQIIFHGKIMTKVILRLWYVKLINLIKIRLMIFMDYHKSQKLCKKMTSLQINKIKLLLTKNSRCIKPNRSFKVINCKVFKIIQSYLATKEVSINKQKKQKVFVKIRLQEQDRNKRVEVLIKNLSKLMRASYRLLLSNLKSTSEQSIIRKLSSSAKKFNTNLTISNSLPTMRKEAK